MLRPDLFQRLDSRRRFGGVIVANEGLETTSVITDRGDGRHGRTVEQWGEYYRINCPVCRDTRHRLYVNYLWGAPDAETGTRNWWLCYCFNEDCMKSHENRMRLKEAVYDDANPLNADDVIRPGKRHAFDPHATFKLPGHSVPVWELSLWHPAVAYLVDRGFTGVARAMGLHYCEYAVGPESLATNRLIIPVRMEGRIQTWQARYLGRGDPPPGVPKYFTCPGSHKSQVLYNFDEAVSAADHVFAVEGPTDVWRYGPEAVASLGKKLSQTQLSLLMNRWSPILLGPDTNDPDALVKAKQTAAAIRQAGRSVEIIHLPPNTDPGAIPTDDLRRLVHQQAAAAGHHLTYRRTRA